ncbi:endonuclease/exonuclease/phosphatase family protein [Jatrophihabitans endophyticus]|uniref:endonuclease/exonuclease/phosphatase family protein n=1 Tax=Jatrophihabitans endophyticus TaxID=1206085 RepID=UPI0019F45675|nr:endonuclease/exonuclease/phosphatase family protein [Jatrophihabitans endophyticus]MBE7188999.1 endonuclease/exonuclease/phosphatase family protein [Jatrophihabitans endophyticus]
MMPSLPRRILQTSVPRSGPRWFGAVLAVLLLVAAVVGLVAHFRAGGRVWVLAVSAFAPYLMVGAPLALLVLLAARLWLPSVLALGLTAACVATQLPLYVATAPPAQSTSLMVMTSNLKLGSAQASSVVDAVRRHRVDVLMLEELTAPEQRRLMAAGLGRVLPHHISDPAYAALGTGLWSRYPLSDTVSRHDFAFRFVTARISPPHVTRPVQLGAAHMAGPYPTPTNWHADIAHLPSVLRTLGAGRTAIVAGDLNATPDETQFRALLTDGWEDGADQAGAGYTRTYPSDRSFPPLIAIDHVLTHRAVATSAQTVEIDGSDHRALVERIALPRSRPVHDVKVAA